MYIKAVYDGSICVDDVNWIQRNKVHSVTNQKIVVVKVLTELIDEKVVKLSVATFSVN